MKKKKKKKETQIGLILRDIARIWRRWFVKNKNAIFL